MCHQGKRKSFSNNELQHLKSAYVKLENLDNVELERTNFCAFNVNGSSTYKFSKGRLTDEVAINDKIVRIQLITNQLNLRVSNKIFSPQRNKRALMLSNDDLNKSIIKTPSPSNDSQSKSVSFNNTFYITPISPRQGSKSPTPVQSSYESMFKEYLKKMNGSISPKPNSTNNNEGVEEEKPEIKISEATEKPPSTPPPPPPPPPESSTELFNDSDEDEENFEVETLDDEPPKRKRGRPKGSGRVRSLSTVNKDPNYSPNSPTPKKRGWPLGLPRRKFVTYKNVHTPYTPPDSTSNLLGTPLKRGPGRPRKIIAFGFQTIVSEIKTVSLPSELWSAHVSVTSKRSQVCFTRVVQSVSNAVPFECDRSIKFNGSVNYIVRINNREMTLVGAPPAVSSIKDIETLLQIVNEIDVNDPILDCR